MNQYTQLLSYIKTLADSDDLLNTVTQDEPEKIDWDKTTIFPLLHVSILGGNFTNGSTITFNVELVCVNPREDTNDSNDGSYLREDNAVDNMNTALAILNRLWTSMHRGFVDKNIVASEEPSFDRIVLDYTNQCDGWQLSFSVDLPNSYLNLCP